jgi:hypothetical protein
MGTQLLQFNNVVHNYNKIQRKQTRGLEHQSVKDTLEQFPPLPIYQNQAI